VLNRRLGYARFDQLDSPAVRDLVIGCRRHGDGPPEMIGDTQTHEIDYLLVHAGLADVETGRTARGWRR
jgi:hypothetical protein